MYLLGLTTPEETLEIEQAAAQHEELREAIDQAAGELERFALANATEPNTLVKPLFLASIDYATRLENGERPGNPPQIRPDSTIDEFAAWVDRPDMVQPEWSEDLYAKIIGYTPEALTAILWVKTSTPNEAHDHEQEKLLILDGTCDVYVDDQVFSLQRGDVFFVPMHKSHVIKITSDIPCKCILQRSAA